MKKRVTQQGIALIAVLWVVAFLTIIASTIAHQSRSSLQMTKNRIAMLQVKQAAEGAMLVTIANLLNAPENVGALGNGKIGQFTIDDIEVEISLYDESGKIDLNTAPVTVLQALLLEIGLDEGASSSVANAILDWRDRDNLVRAGGAEDQNYYAAGLSYGSKDDNFRRVEELSMVYGVSPQLYSALSPHVTVYTQDFGVNLSVASPLVRRVVKNASNLLEGGSVVEEEELLFGGEEGFDALSGGYIYTVQAKARTKDGVFKQFSAIIRLDRGNTFEPFSILNWAQI